MFVIRTAARMDYWKHWSLSSPPFARSRERDLGADFYCGTPQREAIARLHYLIGGNLDCGLLIADAGCGLSSLLDHVSQSTGIGDTAVETVLTSGNNGSEADAWERLASVMRVRSSGAGVSHDVQMQAKLLARQDVRLVWLVDGCDAFAARVARTLMNSSAMTVLLGVNPDDAREVCVEVGQCPLRMDLSPFSLEETSRYVDWAIRNVRVATNQSSRDQVFADTALVRLHELSEGRIGWIGKIAELALMIGAAHQMNRIDVDLLESVQGELVRAA